jgi:phosphoribosylaminoimidazole carboxylase (NCAIR synthetase)
VTLLVLGWQREVVAALTAEQVDFLVLAGQTRWRRAEAHADQNRWMPVLDHCDLEQVAPVALGLIRSGRTFEAVYTQDEFAMVTAAALADVLGVPFMPVSTAIGFRHKPTQKELLRRAGLPVADWQDLWPRPEVTCRQLAEFGPPLVVKPVDGAGVRLTEAARTPGELAELLDRWPSDFAGQARGFMVERLVEGRECHFDGIVEAGTVRLFALCRYRQNLLAIRTGSLFGSLVVDRESEPELWTAARQLCQRALTALNLRSGPFHLEVFDTGRGLVFGECAARIGGAFTAQMIRHKYGFDLFTETARQLAHRPLGTVKPSPGAVGYTVLSAPAGTLVTAPSEAELLRWTGVLRAKLEVQPGRPVPDTTRDTMTRSGMLLLTAPDEGRLTSLMDEYARRFRQLCTVA